MAGTERDIKNKVFPVTGGTSIRVSGFPNRRQAERSHASNLSTISGYAEHLSTRLW
jgi:hypothetical protein